MRKLLTLTLSLVFLTSVVLSGTSFAAIGTGAEAKFVDEDFLLADTLHSNEDGSETGFEFNGDEVHSQNGATITVSKDASNTDNAGFIHKYDGSKLTYHGKDSASNGNSGMRVTFLPGENDIANALEYAEFNISTNAPGRTYLSLYNNATTLHTLCWANSGFSGGLVRIEIDRREASLTSDNKAPVKVYLNGNETASTSVDVSEYGITIFFAAYKTPTITMSSVKYGYVKSVAIPALNYTKHSSTLIDSLNASASGSAERIVYNGDETHTQNDAFVTVKKDASNASDNGYINKYDGSMLTYHGANDNANNGNSGVIIQFMPGKNDITNAIEYVTFALKTNAPGRTYAKIMNGSSDITILSWANSSLQTNVNHIVRVEIDRTQSALTSDGKAPIRVYVDSVLTHTTTVNAGEYGIGLWLAAYKTPTVTVSSVKYGYEKSLLSADIWLSTLHNGGGSGTSIEYNGDETHSQNGVSVNIEKDAANTGVGYINKYDGSKLTYHGKNDNANQNNSGVNIVFDSGSNSVDGSIETLEFDISTNAPGRTYARVLYGSTTLYLACHANTNLTTGQNHKIRVEIDRRPQVLTDGISAKATVYKDGEDVSRVNIPANPDGKLKIWLAAYKTPTVTISSVKYGKAVLNGNIDSITIDEENRIAKVKVLNPVVEGIGQYGNNAALIVAGYTDNGKLLSLTLPDGEQIVGEAVLETKYQPTEGVTKIKAFLWDADTFMPLCESAEK